MLRIDNILNEECAKTPLIKSWAYWYDLRSERTHIQFSSNRWSYGSDARIVGRLTISDRELDEWWWGHIRRPYYECVPDFAVRQHLREKVREKVQEIDYGLSARS